MPSTTARDASSTTFVDNMALPVHRWFRYSAGFSAAWATDIIAASRADAVLDPFAGSGTTLLAAEACGADALGLDAHVFVARVGQAKLAWRSEVAAYDAHIDAMLASADATRGSVAGYPSLIRQCYGDATLRALDRLRRAYEAHAEDSPASRLAWLTLVAILRKTSRAGTAQWQYVLPKKAKRAPLEPRHAFEQQRQMVRADMLAAPRTAARARYLRGDARDCAAVPDGFADLVLTSPPYPNNFDYADATRLEMSFMRELDRWAELQAKVRGALVRSCSQHVRINDHALDALLANPLLHPIADALRGVCAELAAVRLDRGGKKTYHLMVAAYFADLAATWHALRRVCKTPSRVCFVIGDSAPYGVYVPVVPWLGALALSAGFSRFTFEKTRDRNAKWQNRKHRVPLQEGRLWVEG